MGKILKEWDEHPTKYSIPVGALGKLRENEV